MRFMLAILTLWASCWAGAGAGQQRPAPLSAQTQPLSPAVLATMLSRGQELELVVLWRGSPGWFLQGSRRGASGGESGGIFSGTLNYGGRELRLSFERDRRTASIQGKSVTLPENANVILVDNVDREAGPAVAGLLHI